MNISVFSAAQTSRLVTALSAASLILLFSVCMLSRFQLFYHLNDNLMGINGGGAAAALMPAVILSTSLYRISKWKFSRMGLSEQLYSVVSPLRVKLRLSLLYFTTLTQRYSDIKGKWEIL